MKECAHDCRLPNPAGGAWFCAWCGAYPLTCTQGQEANLTDVASALQQAWRERDEARNEVKFVRAIYAVREGRTVRETASND
jgi:hypothetical protein